MKQTFFFFISVETSERWGKERGGVCCKGWAEKKPRGAELCRWQALGSLSFQPLKVAQVYCFCRERNLLTAMADALDLDSVHLTDPRPSQEQLWSSLQLGDSHERKEFAQSGS
jgi:hypothetical protein